MHYGCGCAQPAEARSCCFRLPVACQSDLLSLEKHRPAAAAKISLRLCFSRDTQTSRGSLDKIRSRLHRLNGITRTCVPLLASLSLTSCHCYIAPPAQLSASHRPISGLLLGRAEKETKRILSTASAVHSPNCPLCPRRTGCKCLHSTDTVTQNTAPIPIGLSEKEGKVNISISLSRV